MEKRSCLTKDTAWMDSIMSILELKEDELSQT